ncbi:MAG: T9SS type A sorting domain-containing protein [Bacteroidia bacterium]|nr:T9SS type A sorting domain-containing protein [Bacteroidia bacterium]
MDRKRRNSPKNNLQQTTSVRTLAFSAGIVTMILAGVFMLTRQNNSSGVTGNQGPGGIGNDTDLKMWFLADMITGIADGRKIPLWEDFSSNRNDASATNKQMPAFYSNISNGRPVVFFDGSDDYFQITGNTDLNTGGPYTEKSFIVAFNTGSDVVTRQFLFEQGSETRGLNIYIEGGNLYVGGHNLAKDAGNAPWGYASISSPITPSSPNLLVFNYDQPSRIITGYLNGNSMGTVNVGKLFGDTGGIGLGGVNGRTYNVSGPVGTTGNYFKGSIMEFINFNKILNSAQSAIIQNYLSAKYNIEIPEDYFAYEATHSYEVAGIGQSGGESHTDAKGSGIVRIYDPNDLDDGEFLFWGHNGVNISQGNAEDVDGVDIKSRLERTWQVEQTGRVGVLTIEFDLSSLSHLDADQMRLIVERNGDNFKSLEFPPLEGIFNLASQRLRFSGVNLEDGDIFTLGSTDFQFPVEFLFLEAKPEADHVALAWATANELNNDYFTVERSADGAIFIPLANLKGVGNASTTSNYSFTDTKPISGTAIYRIKQTDLDGSYSYSQKVEIALDTDISAFILYPNPLTDGSSLNLNFHLKEATSVGITIQDIKGTVLHQENHSGNQGENVISVTPSDWPAGNYFIRLSNGSRTETRRFIIK